MKTNGQKIKEFCEELLKRQLTWKGMPITGLRIHGNNVIMDTVGGSGNFILLTIQLEQWLFDPKAELVNCIWDATKWMDKDGTKMIEPMYHWSELLYIGTFGNEERLNYLIEATLKK